MSWLTALFCVELVVAVQMQVPEPPSSPALLGEDDALEEPVDEPWWEEGFRRSLDLSSRYSTRFRGNPTGVNVVGIDLHRVFSSEYGDIGTLVFQAYLTRLDGARRPPLAFDDGHDWELIYRILNFNYTGLSKNTLNIRVGHFEFPFGLEHLIDTNGTLRDYTHNRNFTFKTDWGLTINGELASVEYEVAVSRGSGNEFRSRSDPFVVSGRLGTRRTENLVLGISAFYGEVYQGGGLTLRRHRAALDAQYYYKKWGSLAELAIGRDGGRQVVNGVVELNWRDSSEQWLLYTQGLVFNEETAQRAWDERLAAVAGVRFLRGDRWSVSVQGIQELEDFTNSTRDLEVAVQFRIRY